MLLGTYSSRLTKGRRIAIPKKFRQEIGDKFIVARWYEGCLVLVSITNWRELLNKLTGHSKIITAPVRDTDRFILGSAFELEIDSQGRVILPASLVNYAELKDDVIFIGLGGRVEIWDKQLWQKREDYLTKEAGKLVEKLARQLNPKEVG